LDVYLIPLDATNKVTWSGTDARSWKNSPILEIRTAGEILEWMLTKWSIDSAYIWDLVAAVVATDTELCQQDQVALEVLVEHGPDQGKTFIRDSEPNASVCLEPEIWQIRARVESILEMDYQTGS
jgi:inosine-uridine nucleoside N-ribohydrolase